MIKKLSTNDDIAASASELAICIRQALDRKDVLQCGDPPLRAFYPGPDNLVTISHRFICLVQYGIVLIA